MKRYNKTPDAEYLKQILDADFGAGTLRWKHRDDKPDWWNKKFAGRPAFVTPANGYRQGIINGKNYRTHRILWKMRHGADPEHEIDHINGNRADNRIENLRAVTPGQNGRNKRLRSDNPSGHHGVQRFKRDDCWRARIKDDTGREIHLGYFAELSDAVAARKAAERQFGYSKHHGNAPLDETPPDTT